MGDAMKRKFHRHPSRFGLVVLAALVPLFTFLLGTGTPAGAESFAVTNLVTDDQSVNAPQTTDSHLVNA
jgi:hypothetical protein